MNQDQRPFDVLMRCTGVHKDHRHALLWAYDKDDPAVVELVFVPELISWRFDRDLLFTAAIQGAPAGLGDVMIQPSYSSERGNHLVLTLRNEQDGPVDDFFLDRRTAQKFLYSTMDLVQLGEEDYSAHVDAFLHALMLGRES
jgi:hypothetical protein